MLKKDLQKRIKFLEDAISTYYDANYDAKVAIKDRNGLTAAPMHTGRPRMCGEEECMGVKDFEGACKLIEKLPLMDCGI